MDGDVEKAAIPIVYGKMYPVWLSIQLGQIQCHRE